MTAKTTDQIGSREEAVIARAWRGWWRGADNGVTDGPTPTAASSG